jgi:hypothetical protein
VNLWRTGLCHTASESLAEDATGAAVATATDVASRARARVGPKAVRILDEELTARGLAWARS